MLLPTLPPAWTLLEGTLKEGCLHESFAPSDSEHGIRLDWLGSTHLLLGVVGFRRRGCAISSEPTAKVPALQSLDEGGLPAARVTEDFYLYAGKVIYIRSNARRAGTE